MILAQIYSKLFFFKRFARSIENQMLMNRSSTTIINIASFLERDPLIGCWDLYIIQEAMNRLCPIGFH